MADRPMQMLSELERELREVSGLIAVLHKRLGEQNRSRPPEENELRLLWDRRDTVVSRIGSLVSEQLLAGAGVELSASDTESTSAAPAPAPAKQTAPAAFHSEPVVRVARRRVAARAPEAVQPIGNTRLAEFLTELGSPEPARSVEAFLETYERLRYVATHCNRWLEVPAKAQRHLVGAVVAWMRDLQECNDDFGRPLREPQVVGLISRLSHWSRENRPGWVNGLARGATPDGASWRQDTLYHLEALQGMLTPARASSVDPLERLRHALNTGSTDWLATLDSAIDAGLSQSDPALVELFVNRPELLEGSDYVTLLRRIYERSGGDAFMAAGETMDFVPVGWSWMDYCRGQHALLLGGSPSATTAAALKDAFEFSKVTWDPADARREGPIVRRIASGAVDLVLFLADDAEPALEQPVDDACADADVHLVIVEGAVTVRNLRLSIEDELEPNDPTPTSTEQRPRA